MSREDELGAIADRLRAHYKAIESDATFGASPYRSKYRKDGWDKERLDEDEATLARAYLAEHPPVGGRRDMNLVMGVATNIMTALGMSWENQVAILCNFAGPFEETKARWDAANHDAHERIRETNEVIATIGQLIETSPSIDYEADPMDLSPIDAAAHVAGLIVQELRKLKVY